MDHSDRFFAINGPELDIRDAVLALERVLDVEDLEIPARITLEAAVAALRELEGASASSPEEIAADSIRRTH
jgi:hypothetical protein